MKHVTILASVFGIFTAVAGAMTTPLTEPLAEEKEITITCELTEAPKRKDIVVFDSAKQCEASQMILFSLLCVPCDLSGGRSSFDASVLTMAWARTAAAC